MDVMTVWFTWLFFPGFSEVEIEWCTVELWVSHSVLTDSLSDWQGVNISAGWFTSIKTVFVIDKTLPFVFTLHTTDFAPLSPHTRDTASIMPMHSEVSVNVCNEEGTHCGWTGDEEGNRLYLQKSWTILFGQDGNEWYFLFWVNGVCSVLPDFSKEALIPKPRYTSRQEGFKMHSPHLLIEGYSD